MLPIALEEEKVKVLLEKGKKPNYKLKIDLENQTLSDDKGLSESFTISSYWKKMLINGWDEIEITLQLDEQISTYEKNRALLTR
jgi:3-isopropylmalate/(R)-2-methylmalate dehydratase small subunit